MECGFDWLAQLSDFFFYTVKSGIPLSNDFVKCLFKTGSYLSQLAIVKLLTLKLNYSQIFNQGDDPAVESQINDFDAY